MESTPLLLNSGSLTSDLFKKYLSDKLNISYDNDPAFYAFLWQNYKTSILKKISPQSENSPRGEQK